MIVMSKHIPDRKADISRYTRARTENVRKLHERLPEYAPSPLLELPGLACRLGLRSVLIKDESTRFGLNAFKGLGSVYAVFRVLCRELGLDPEEADMEAMKENPYRERIAGMDFLTTTDGNHGKGVAWAASRLGARAHVFMPRGTVPVRAEAIRKAGASEVEITDMTYDECVAWTRDLAEKRGWFLVQDTSWPGYEQVPEWIMQGYTTLVFEAHSQIARQHLPEPTHIMLQAGVGSMAGAVMGAAADCFGLDLHFATVEAREAACFYESFRDGRMHMAEGSGETLMAGLNCALPCPLAWNVIDSFADMALACENLECELGMRLMGRPCGTDPKIISGESGAVPLGVLHEVMTEKTYTGIREAFGLGADSVVLLVNTEGATDPEHYRRVMES